MDKRIKLGIPFIYDIRWIGGGAYYVANLIEGLNLLSDEKKPHIIIYFDSNKAINLIKDIGYPYISFKRRYSLFIRICNKLSRTFIKKNLFALQALPNEIDLLFPAKDNFYFQPIAAHKKIYWIQDFQEHFLPAFFTPDEISLRKKRQNELVDKNARIIFSSNTSRSDFFSIYPNAKNKTHVLSFAVSHSKEYQSIPIRSLIEKFDLPDNYFFCANQFWAHKNHITVLKALALLKQKGKNVAVAFSGHQGDHRNTNFFGSLLKYVLDNNLEANTRFLGFIDRNEQLALMKNSQGIIQPSLFEGWSSVVEDVKSLDQSLILSDIPIHREQINKNVRFFDPLNEIQLAEILENFNCEPEFCDYSKNRIRFAETFHSILVNAAE